VLAFPHKQATQDLQRYLDAFLDHDTTDHLPEITAPTLVLAGGRHSTARPELGRAVAELIPGARFEVMEDEAHQPFQEPRTGGTPGVNGFRRQIEVRD
jgi:3-oxoadipate enol-lactonase